MEIPSNVLNRVAPLWVAAGLICAIAAPAQAATVPVSSGNINLTAATYAVGAPSPLPNGNISLLSVPGTYHYGNSYDASQAGFTVLGTTNGFYDDWVVTLGAAALNTVTSTIALDASLGISNLNVELYNYTANGGLTPVTGTPSGTFWTATTLINSGGVTTEQIKISNLAAGTYVLQVSGLADGQFGGSYSGTLNVAPVTTPLPAALPLLLSGLLGFVGLGRRKR